MLRVILRLSSNLPFLRAEDSVLRVAGRPRRPLGRAPASAGSWDPWGFLFSTRANNHHLSESQNATFFNALAMACPAPEAAVRTLAVGEAEGHTARHVLGRVPSNTGLHGHGPPATERQ